MPTKTRGTKLGIGAKCVKHLMSLAKLTEDEQNYILTIVMQPEQLVALHNVNQMKNAFTYNTQLSFVSLYVLGEVALFISKYMRKNGSYDKIKKINEGN